MQADNKAQLIRSIKELLALAEQWEQTPAEAMHSALLKQKCLHVYEQIVLHDAAEPAVVSDKQEPAMEVLPGDVPAAKDTGIATLTDSISNTSEPVKPAAEPLAEANDFSLFDASEAEDDAIEDEADEVDHTDEEEEETIPESPEVSIPEPDVMPGIIAPPAPMAEENLAPPMPPVALPESEVIPGIVTPKKQEEKAGEESLFSRFNRTIEHTPSFGARIESLKSAISLNKKIAFVNDLFKENTVEYAKAIEKLNTASDYNEAMRFFSELKHQHGWDNGNELVKDLEALVHKRYAGM